MSVTVSKTAGLPAAPVAAPQAAPREPDPVEYPEGHWIAQSTWHGDALRLATAALHHHFRDRKDVMVAMELMVYYRRGDKEACLQPDVQVAFGVRHRRGRSVYKVWEEGKAPDFVLEVASPSTAARDARHKAREYARIGVREYWRLDPKGSLMEAPLEGWAARGGRFDPVEPIGSRGRHLPSQVLGLDLRCRRRHGGTVLVFRDPRTGEEFARPLELVERARRLAEKRASVAEKRASAAEKRVRALEERLRSLPAGTPRQRDG